MAGPNLPFSIHSSIPKPSRQRIWKFLSRHPLPNPLSRTDFEENQHKNRQPESNNSPVDDGGRITSMITPNTDAPRDCKQLHCHRCCISIGFEKRPGPSTRPSNRVSPAPKQPITNQHLAPFRRFAAYAQVEFQHQPETEGLACVSRHHHASTTACGAPTSQQPHEKAFLTNSSSKRK